MPPPLRAIGLLPALAWSNAALHGAGLVFAWFVLRPGSVTVPLADRMAYLASDPPAWAWAWGVWALCSLLLVAFLAALWRLLPERSALAQLALVLAAAGMAVDLLCDVVQARILPFVAEEPDLFLAFERLAFTGGLTVANGLYTAGMLCMNLRLRGLITAPARIAGWATVLAGTAMAIAGLFPVEALLIASTGPTILFYSLWTVLVARDLSR
jgi:hypothetical protein